MAMGQKQAQQAQLFVTHSQLPQSLGHPFYVALERELRQAGFDAFVEALCAPLYAAPMGRPSIPPGVYFRCLFVGYFEGIRSERGIAWRVADSLSLRTFLGVGLEQQTPEHSTLSRTRHRLSEAIHQQVFDWVLARLGESGLVCGRTLGIDASTLEANAAMRSLERRDSGQRYQDFLCDLAKAEGIANPTKEDCARLDRKRKNKASNAEWVSSTDAGARVTKMKDGRTHLAYKNEHAVDLDTGAIVAVTVQEADKGDTQSLPATLEQAEASLIAIREESARQVRPESGIEEVVADKGYHSDETLRRCEEKGIRTYVSEPKRQRRWKGKSAQQRTVHRNRRRIRGKRGKALLRKRGELVERPFAHRLDRGRLRRLHVRGKANIHKQELLLAAAQNLGLLLRAKYGVGTPRRMADRSKQARQAHIAASMAHQPLDTAIDVRIVVALPRLQQRHDGQRCRLNEQVLSARPRDAVVRLAPAAVRILQRHQPLGPRQTRPTPSAVEQRRRAQRQQIGIVARLRDVRRHVDLGTQSRLLGLAERIRDVGIGHLLGCAAKAVQCLHIAGVPACAIAAASCVRVLPLHLEVSLRSPDGV